MKNVDCIPIYFGVEMLTTRLAYYYYYYYYYYYG